MLSLFPSLLDYSFAAITLLRVAAGLTVLYLSFAYASERKEISHTKVWLVGHVPEWLTLIGSLVLLVSGILLVIGLFTQAVAIVGMIIALKIVIFGRRYQNIIALSPAAGALLFVICLSLLFSGAGAFSFDLPI